ncbi:MAG: hypothetical protein GF368_02745 [Candidatus Aenigmarchaeota archaeon]|nr:hypothetical protein [Candidatus Aenigmarchaeota archaeon]
MVIKSCSGTGGTLTKPTEIKVMRYVEPDRTLRRLPLVSCGYQGVHPGEASRCTAGGEEPYPTCLQHRAYGQS